MIMRRYKVFIVEDHPLLRRGYAYIIEREPDMEVVGEASTAPEALSQIARTRPDLVITDISLEAGSGLELIRDLRSHDPDLPILVVSVHDENLYAERVLRAGAQGYLMKRSSEDNIFTAIRRVLNGGFYFSDKINHKLLSQHHNGRTAARVSVELLTDRELEIFMLIGSGLNIRDIANKLNISPKTVESHRGRIKKKLAVDTSANLLRYAMEWEHTHRS